jgi:hypothetical protein
MDIKNLNTEKEQCKGKQSVIDYPCNYSLEEVKQRLHRTEADALAGRGLSMEEVEEQSEKWLL